MYYVLDDYFLLVTYHSHHVKLQSKSSLALDRDDQCGAEKGVFGSTSQELEYILTGQLI